ncbi:MAG: transcriptional repressor [Sphingobacteriales bacterium]|nr:transcriptional repressor [Sphingobacteriales bacterium]
MQTNLEKILRDKSLSVTDGRKKILTLFLNSKGALSHADIERRSGEHFDRVTIYRTLQTFVEKGIVHTIPTDDNTIMYALCKDGCAENHHHDDHIHFMCTSCGKTECLNEVHIPEIRIPAGYLTKETQIVIKGICKECS